MLELIENKKDVVEKQLNRYLEDPETGCWNWTGPLTTASRNSAHRYGSTCIKYNGKPIKIKAHRLSYAYHNNKDPGNLLVLHRCDNPRCIRPSHLFAGTSRENTQDMMKKNRHGFPHNRKLNLDQVKIVLPLLDKMRNAEIAKIIDGATPDNISAIRLGRSWSDYTGIQPKRKPARP